MTQITLKAAVLGILFFVLGVALLIAGAPLGAAAFGAFGAAIPAGVLYVRASDYFNR